MKSIVRGWVLCICLAVLSLAAQIQEEVEFKFFNSSEQIPEGGDVVSGVMATPGGRLVFIPPPEWNLQARIREKQLIFSSSEPGLALTMRLDTSTTNTPPIDKNEAWETRIKEAEELEGWDVTRRGVAYTDGMVGISFDLLRVVEGRPRFLRRLVMIPTPLGLVRVELAGHPDTVEGNHFTLATFLTSLRFETGLRRGLPSAKP